MTARSKQTLYDYFCSGGSASNSISTLEQELEDLIDTFYGTWTDYSATSTIVGFSAYTNKYLSYKRIGDFMFVSFYISGTGDNTAMTFTLPYSSEAGSGFYTQFPIRAKDDGNHTIGYGSLPNGESTVTFEPLPSEPGWTASGDRWIVGQFSYEAA